MNRVRKFIGAVGALALGTTILVACSSAPGAGAAATAAASKGAPISVGLLCTCGGSFGADINTSAKVYKAWVDSVNASGGLDGHHINLTVEDDGGNPGTSVSDLQKLVADHVDVLVDDSILDTAWAKTAQQSGIPVVGLNETETPFYTNPDFYPEGQTNTAVAYANAATAKRAGASNLGDLYCAEAPSCQEGVPLIAAAGKKLGVPAVYNASISATAPNYTAQCTAAKQQGVKSLFIGDEAFVIEKVATNCNQQNYTPIYVTEGEGFGMKMASTPGLKDKLWSDYGTIPFFANNAQVKAMNKAVDKYYPGLRTTTTWTQICAQAWASGLLLKDAVAHSGVSSSGSVTPKAVIKGLDKLKGDTLGGMAPPLTFKAGADHKVDCWFTARVQKGKPALADNGRVSCEKG